MIKKDHDDFKKCTKFWICKKTYEEGNVEIKNHKHITIESIEENIEKSHIKNVI